MDRRQQSSKDKEEGQQPQQYMSMSIPNEDSLIRSYEYSESQDQSQSQSQSKSQSQSQFGLSYTELNDISYKSSVVDSQSSASKKEKLSDSTNLKNKTTVETTNKLNIKQSLYISICNPWNYLLGSIAFCVSSVLLAFNGLWLISYMTLKFGYSRQLATIVTNSYYISMAIMTLVYGKLITFYQRRKIFVILSSLMQCASIYVIYCDSDTHLSVIFLCNIFAGCGAAIFPLIFTLVGEYNSKYGCSDVAGGLVNTINTSSGFLMQWLVGLLMDVHWRMRGADDYDESKNNSNSHNDNDNKGHRNYTVSDYDYAFVVIPIIVCLNVLLSLFVRETNGKPLL